MKIYIFGNGNTTFENFQEYYLKPIEKIIEKKEIEFILCDFRGVDTLTMEYLKAKTNNVTLLHIGDKPRYIPDKYKTKVSSWNIIGNFENDNLRDDYAIERCTHFIAKDFNSNKDRKSGTQKNIEKCIEKNKIEFK